MYRLITARRGFTLIELLVTLSIVSILAAIAIPAYHAQTEKSRLADARAALTQDGHFLERWYADNGTYKQGSSAWPALPVSETDYYLITFTSLPSGTDGSAYILQARPKPQFSSASATYLKLDQDGNLLSCTAPGGTERCAL